MSSTKLEGARSQTKPGSGSRPKSQSPGKGAKKGAKKEEKPPSPKKDTKLKKRGEESDTFFTIGNLMINIIPVYNLHLFEKSIDCYFNIYIVPEY